jgi:hypothetical protein
MPERKTLILALALGCAAVLGPSPASPAASASPVMRVDYRFTAVGGKHLDQLVEARIAGSGTLLFDDSPLEGRQTPADRTTGVVVFEYETIANEQTHRLRLRVVRGEYAETPSAQVVLLHVVVIGTDGDTTCPTSTRGTKTGAKGIVTAADAEDEDDSSKRFETYSIALPGCKIQLSQQAAPGRTSRVHVAITPKCLRTTQARKPLCGKAAVKSCRLGGTWFQTTETVGSTTWTTTADGKAQEAGLGNATGRATLTASVLTITWTTVDGWAGVYRWTLDKTCSGKGTLSFTKGPRAGETVNSTVRGSPS